MSDDPSIQERLAVVETELKQLNSGIAEVKKSLYVINSKFDNIIERVTKLETADKVSADVEEKLKDDINRNTNVKLGIISVIITGIIIISDIVLRIFGR
ncbi:MAG: hypothetical protein QXF80_06820 [Thermoplasmatales archaeon]